MELTLSENIRKLRKERSLTQEQLADVFGVSTGAVYKWEAGLSLPELNLIVEMADFFDTSVDTLLGYKMKDNRLDSAIKRILEYAQARDPEALSEAEKTLKKYPHSFKVVRNCAEIYLMYGAGNRNKEHLLRALDLLEQARLLLSQNQDPTFSELSIFGLMASVWLLLGEKEKSIEIMKKNNTEGIFNDSIGTVLSCFMKRPEEAEPYLSDSLLRSLSILFNTICGYIFVFCSRNDYSSAEEILLWGINILQGVKKYDAPDYMAKTEAEIFIMLAFVQLKTGRRNEAVASLKKADAYARLFDVSPNYNLRTIRFVTGAENLNIQDALSATAAGSIEMIMDILEDQELAEMWKEVAEHE